VESDVKNLTFSYAHEEVLKEAKKDIGMPYNKNRGSSGPYHGYSAGYCTDLILDAYTWGADFNIQFALEMDYKTNPWHIYRWRDARDAHDMWRYFSYSGQLHQHHNDYLPGDIVFFDWSEDGEIDHVALVAEVDYRNRPEMLIDATGVINSNPSGLTAELPWEPFHEQTARGFARWSGKYEPIAQKLPVGSAIQFSFGGSDLDVRLIDSHGESVSAFENEISGAWFTDLIWEQAISIKGSFSDQSQYLILIKNLDIIERSIQFSAQFIQDGLVNVRIEDERILDNSKITRIPILLTVDDLGQITIEIINPDRRIEGNLNVH